ncbi:acyl-CoA dehydrogenase family protein [Actinomadura verrucosospora]|uniref:Acyl-CoA dehydrogenase/oxidase N-terminal domain-containing protein n=1 Tax=Actinomadura verrucosospora TaxID=46165 RepID=A0A7D3VTX9_ACTVE|nr:acyl-CoA dehydrogenase family protein [Actinomadura verrucosospora]QKG22960.1 hypothetical protein ACTIVE_4601 [Actinomadura verrucosospora]
MTTSTRDQPARRAAPRDHAGWLDLARTTAADPAVDDPDGRHTGRPQATAAEALRRSGLFTLLIPARCGGGGATWRTAFQVVREVAAVNGDIGLLLGHHYLLSWTPALIGTDEDRERVWPGAAAGSQIWGGAPDPRDTSLTLTPRPHGGFTPGRHDGDHLRRRPRRPPRRRRHPLRHGRAADGPRRSGRFGRRTVNG